MKILVLGGTRFFGIHMVNDLIEKGHDVTIATRGNTPDDFGDSVSRMRFERTDEDSIKAAIAGTHYDVIIDKIAYCSNDIRKLMDAADCDKYIYMSSTAVYDPKHINTVEEDFDGTDGELIWCDRKDFPYDVIKRQAEYALWQKYPEKNWIAVRYPFVTGKDDYTRRLYFYVEHVLKQLPMKIDNADSQMSFIRSDEAGKFLSFLVDKDFKGAVNGSSKGTVSIREVLDYLEKETGMSAVINDDGDPAPYNGETEYSINIEKAESLGFAFTELKDWLYPLLDYYIDVAHEGMLGLYDSLD
ncbi:MAG: NAD-dependent epimerase/dehydratase family protein [Ruminococcaceae bacterium]|nr:NAD-dependent epimerase/dehydratase family protein [Oscillospiraceae bacterium]